MLIQIVLTILIVYFIWRAWERKNRQEITIREASLWSVFWLVAMGVLWVPDSMTRIANLLGIGRGADLVLYFGLAILFYMVFRAYVRMEKIERDITKIVRKIALDSVGHSDDSHNDRNDRLDHEKNSNIK